MKVSVIGVFAVVLCGTSLAQGPQLPEQDRVLARQIFKEFIETNSQDSNGSGGGAIEHNDHRMHGRDEPLSGDSYYKSVEFFYLYLKSLTK